MELKKALQTRYSKEHMDQIVDYIGQDPNRFEMLWNLIRSGEPPIPQYGAWALDKCAERFPALIKPYINEMIEFLPLPNHNAVHRSLTKVLSQQEIPVGKQGILYSLCIDWLLSPKIPVAVKVHSMTIAGNIAQQSKDLKEELAFVIQDQMEFNSAGFKSRGKKILKQLQS